MNTLQLAFAKIGYKPVKPTIKPWPRLRGPKFTRIDCKTGNAVSFIN